MHLEESKYRLIIRKKITTTEGNFYVFDKYVVGEIFEGVSFDWPAAQKVIEEVYKYFGTSDIKISYISNRVNSYSVHPQDWAKFFSNRHKLNCVAVVTHNKLGVTSIILEKLFIQTKLKKFMSLDNAIVWAKMQNGKTEKETA